MQLSLADGSRESQGAAPQATSSHATLVEVTLSLSESQLQLQLPPNRTRRDACQKNIPRPT